MPTPLDVTAYQTVTIARNMVEMDILIVGGGIAGASLGARLAPSRRVMLVEAEDLCGRHATGRSAAFWQASLGGDTPERKLTLASKPMFDENWPRVTENDVGSTPLLRRRGALHLTGPCGDVMAEASNLGGPYAPVHLDRAALDQMVPGMRSQWTGAFYEESCADIEVAAFHAACLGEIRRHGGEVCTDVTLGSAERAGGRWNAGTNEGAIHADILVNAAGAWGDDVARRAGVPGLALEPRRRTVVQLRVGRTGLRDVPLVTDLHQSFYFKGEGDNSVWVCPLDETLADPCDAAPEEIDVAMAIDRFERAVDWPVQAVERKWAGLRTFAPDRRMKFGFDPRSENFFWCAGQGGMGIQTAPAASLLCAALILGDPTPEGIDPADFAPR